MSEVIDIQPEARQLLGQTAIEELGVLPVRLVAGGVHLLTREDLSPAQRLDIEFRTGRPCSFETVGLSTFNKLIESQFTVSGSPHGELTFTEDFLDRIIREAVSFNSSDIHFEPGKEVFRVRIRMDGVLVVRYHITPAEYPAIVNKIKIRAGLDIAEKRLPQDGRIALDLVGTDGEARVSVLPTLYGEKVVLRILNSQKGLFKIPDLGMNTGQLRDFLEAIRSHQGIILISGPTGSGKTTTLYAALSELNKEQVNILTVEDPVEYTMPGVNQVQLKESIGLGFAETLRSFLRQDPDIIMLGEIRDGETAQMAVRAALTGHLVFSTIHTNSAWGVIARLMDMGVPALLLAQTLVLSVAQRLVRLLCDHCKQEVPFDRAMLPAGFQTGQFPETVYKPAGCSRCMHTGYKGRVAIYEVIRFNERIKSQIHATEEEIAQLNRESGTASLRDQAFELVCQGRTSPEQVFPLLMKE